MLPISIATKKNENRYLDVLQAWSRQAREFWRVTWLDSENCRFEFLGDKRRRQQFSGRVPEAAFSLIEDLARRTDDALRETREQRNAQ